MASHVELLATGDLGPCRNDPASIFAHVRDRLHRADIVLGQLEPVLTTRGSPLPQARLAMRSTPDTATAIRDAGFDVISFASNHCMEWGVDGFADTLSALRDSQLAVVGAGENISAARKPVIKTVGDTRIAIVARNSILPMGYWAETNRPGCAPMRAWTIQEQIEHDQPGTPSGVHTFANRDDLQMLTEDIRTAKSQADVVILSIHWGIHFVPYVIADYQREVAHAGIDAGADVVIGHHQHILKGIETYRGKVIFHGLGNFAIDPPTAFDKNLRSKRSHKEIAALNQNWEEDGDHIVLRDSAMAIAVRCEIECKQLRRVGALPVHINKESQ
ncbi:MAG TPA: CapA family protein, partial [Steroidobacteraceae bacterium]|nr:CapA family protein [Steroidobacteraceae bacterium]